MEIIDDLITNAIEEIREKHHKRPDDKSICDFINNNHDFENAIITARLNHLLEQNLTVNKPSNAQTSYFIKQIQIDKTMKDAASQTEHNYLENIVADIKELKNEIESFKLLFLDYSSSIKKSTQDSSTYTDYATSSPYVNTLIDQIN